MNEERAQDALRHLQAAAVEMIEAARAALEVVEDIVRDPGALSDLVAAAQARTSAGHEEASATADGAATGPPDDQRSRVTRIQVT